MAIFLERGISSIKEFIREKQRLEKEKLLGKELYGDLLRFQNRERELAEYVDLIEEAERRAEEAGLNVGGVMNSVLEAAGKKRVADREAELGAKFFKDLARGANYFGVRESIITQADSEGLIPDNVFNAFCVFHNPSGWVV
ncbi:hypothetical protein CO054_03170 [Candidatus Shapirobacteria bacterium CG_4_9_14_0_2_um_filter_39_11]|uniref:Uncharacterized protein n=1 Tax=Candidatus Shapirobacteria bacterium CG_4_9_14_0_2_um_filter_39_11 TaxID=1974478 RepID=A0A2M8ES17_9BACT|nr:MAG: hypothetical protein CO054_03170 [Candidatus Shapirobacteria bacterium CG_4_9_14_0_2_um_filter_39_11]